jgi:hypothetical protein
MLQSLVFKGKHRPATSVGDSRDGQLPKRFQLEQNYPNPFNPSTQIRYSVAKNGIIGLKVYDLLGREVATLFEGAQRAGDHVATFDADRFASGIYFYRLTSRDFVETKKMILVQ